MNDPGGGFSAGLLVAVSVSGDASRVILQNSTVYSRSLTLLGNLAPSGVTQVSRDASRAYVYFDDAPGPRLAVYDRDTIS